VATPAVPILRFHAVGPWAPAQVHVRGVPGSGRRVEPEVEAMIDRAWDAARARPGVKLFDGPMCRLESWEASAEALRIVLSETSYKPFLGTNLSHPELADRYGPAILASPVGVSPALITSDGWLMMGRRNASVAYYPNRVHPFAGALDPADADPFSAIRRELREELAFTDEDIAQGGMHCTGVAEDLSIRQPELIFSVRTTRTRSEVEAKLDDAEHHDTWATPATPQGIEAALSSGEAFTPVGVAAMVLWGAMECGRPWCERVIGPFAVC
jgi:8-oxo-dGTP pyrophosphatase MutT (NUDIX family)